MHLPSPSFAQGKDMLTLGFQNTMFFVFFTLLYLSVRLQWSVARQS